MSLAASQGTGRPAESCARWTFGSSFQRDEKGLVAAGAAAFLFVPAFKSLNSKNRQLIFVKLKKIFRRFVMDRAVVRQLLLTSFLHSSCFEGKRVITAGCQAAFFFAWHLGIHQMQTT